MKKSLNSLLGSSLFLCSLAFCLTSSVFALPPSSKSAADPTFLSAVNLYQKHDYQGAFNLFKNLSKASPKVGIYHYYLALCNQCLSRVDEAKIEYQWVVDNDPHLKTNAQAGLNQLSQVRTTSSITKVAAAPSPVATTGSANAAAPTKTAQAQTKGPKTVYDFYTDTCNPCKAMEPIWDEVKSQYKTLEFKRMNAEDPNNAALVQKYGVVGYPTFVVVDGSGKALFNQLGTMDAGRFCAVLDDLLGKK